MSIRTILRSALAVALIGTGMGTTTAHAESDVPFAELSIANPAIADFSTLSDRTIYVLGKAPGRTTLTLFDDAGRLITNIDVHVSTDIAEFKERLRQILPGEKIDVRTANDGIVLSGTVSGPSRMQRALDLAERYAPERVSNLMSVSGNQQVMLKVRFAEMQRSVSKALSANLTLNARSGNDRIGLTGSRLDTGDIAGGGGILGPGPPPAPPSSASISARPSLASCLRRSKPRASCARWQSRT
jgi:pilus assembly protein CpaC